MIKAIGFDYLGVTALLPERSIFDVLAERLGIETPRVIEAYNRYNKQFQVGDMTKDELWQRIASDLGREGDIDIIRAVTSQDLPVIDRDVLAFIDKVRATYKVGLLSNMASGTEWDRDFYKQGIDSHFDAIVLSGDLGVSKPDPRAYQALAAKLGVETSEMVFIDDRPSSMVGVESIGVTPVVYTNLDKLKLDLATSGIKL